MSEPYLHASSEEQSIPMETGALIAYLQRYEDNISKYIKARIPNSHDADDLLQEIFLKVMMKRAAMKDDEYFTAWLFTIVRNSIASLQRGQTKTKIRHEKYANDMEGTLQDKSATQGPKEAIRLAREMLNSLPESLRDVYYFHYVEGMDFEIIGQILDLHPNSVRKDSH